MAEGVGDQVIFSEGSIVITPARVSIRGDHYYVNQIASSKVRYTVETDKGKELLRKLAIIASVFLGLVVGMATKEILVGLFILVAGIVAALLLIKPQYRLYHLYLGLSSGEADVYSSRDSLFVKRINNAVNQALAMRA